MKKENIEKALQACCSDDFYRPALEKPFKQDGYLIATDAHILMAVHPEDASKFDYPDYADNETRSKEKGGYRVPDALSVVKPDERKPYGPSDEFSLNVIRDALEKAGKDPIYEEAECQCEECGGTGKVQDSYYAMATQSDYEVEFECPVCDGTGTVMKETDEVIGHEFSKNQGVGMFGKYFTPTILQKLVTACEALGLNALRLVNFETHSLTFINVPDGSVEYTPVYFLCMSLWLGDDEKNFKLIESGI